MRFRERTQRRFGIKVSLHLLYQGYFYFFILFGTLATFLIPPFQGPDEHAHWTGALVRSHKLFQKDKTFCSPALMLPNNFEDSRIAGHSEQKVKPGSFEKTKDIPPLCSDWEVSYGFVFSYPGVSIAYSLLSQKLDNGSTALLAYYLSRLLQGLIIVIVLIDLIRSAKNKGNSRIESFGFFFLLLLCLTPIFVQESFTVSSDLVCNAFALYLAVWMIRFPTLTGFRLAEYTTLGVIAVCTKPILTPLFIPLALYFYLTHSQKKDSKQEGYLRILLGLSILLTTVGCFEGISAKSVHLVYSQVNPKLQLQFMLTHPIDSLVRLSRSVLHYFHSLHWLLDGLGLFEFGLSYLSRLTFKWMSVLGILCVAASGTQAKSLISSKEPAFINTSKLKLLRYSLVCVGLAASMLLISVYLYLTWTPVGAPVVQGVQGRYFFPHIFLIIGLTVVIVRESFSFQIKRNFKKLGTLTACSSLLLLFIHLISRTMDFMARYW